MVYKIDGIKSFTDLTLTIQTCVLQVIGVGIVFHQFGMSASGEAAQGAGSHGGIKVCRPAHKGELIQTLILAIGTIGRSYFLNVTDGQLQFLAGMSLEHISPTRALSLRPTC